MRLLSGAIALAMLGGCTWKAESEDFKKKWVEETRHHYQTQMIKSAELAEAHRVNEELKTEITQLKEMVARLEAQGEAKK